MLYAVSTLWLGILGLNMYSCKQDALLNPSDEKLPERIQEIETALAKIEKLEPSEFVPVTWHGLY